MYEKVVLTEGEAKNLYREDLIMSDDGRITFRKERYFQEFLGALSFDKESRVVSKGKIVRVGLNFPGHLPLRDPLENWFQVALRPSEIEIADPINCSARYTGFLPGTFVKRDLLKGERSEFYFEDEPRGAVINYALFIYDRADYGSFLDAVEKVLESYLNGGKSLVKDGRGNTVLVSDQATDQAMLLVPVSLLVGGKDYIVEVWDKVLGKGGDN